MQHGNQVTAASEQTKARWPVFGIALSAAGMGFLGLTAALAWYDLSASSAICGAVAFACLIISRLDQIEVFELLGLKAKFREQVSQADALLNTLRKNVIIVTENQVADIARRGRLTTVSWQSRKEDFDRLLGGMTELDADAAVIDKIKRPLLRTATTDMASGAYGVIVARFAHTIRQLPSGANSTPPELSKMEFASFGQGVTSPGIFIAGLRTALAHPQIPQEDRAKMTPLVEKVERLSDEMWRRMELTDDVITFLSSFHPHAGVRDRSLYDQIFTGE